MKKIIFLCLILACTKALAIKCPKFAEDYIDKVQIAIRAANDCKAGVKVASTCAMGSSADGAIAGTAENKCGFDFISKMDLESYKAYEKLQKKCDDKYKDSEGTMAISANAFCRLKVAELYSSIYTSDSL